MQPIRCALPVACGKAGAGAYDLHSTRQDRFNPELTMPD